MTEAPPVEKLVFCRAYRCKTCLPDSEIWVIHHDDSKEHTCQWCGNKTQYIREVPKRKADENS